MILYKTTTKENIDKEGVVIDETKISLLKKLPTNKTDIVVGVSSTEEIEEETKANKAIEIQKLTSASDKLEAVVDNLNLVMEAVATGKTDKVQKQMKAIQKILKG